MAVVFGFVGRVDARRRDEGGLLTACRRRSHREAGPGPNAARDARDVERLLAGKAQHVGRFSRSEFKRYDSHTNQVAAVNALETLSDHGSNAEQTRSFGGPIPRRSRAVFLAGHDEQGHVLTLVLH